MPQVSPIEAYLRAFLKTVFVAGLTTTVLTSAPALAQRPDSLQELPDEAENEIVHVATPEQLTIMDRIAQIGFEEPQLTPALELQIQQLYSYIDPTSVIAKDLLNRALAYYHANASKIPNKNYLTIVDFARHASTERLYIINMSTGAVWSLHVAHGKGSDPGNSGYVHAVSNVSGSNESSVGFYRTAETYSGKHGLSLRIDGLSTTNSNVRMRDIVVHGATYVSDQNIKAGRSDGCFAVPIDDHVRVVEMIKDGSIIYAAKDSAALYPTAE